MKMHLLVSSEV